MNSFENIEQYLKLKTVVEKVLKCHFGEIELLIVSKSLPVRKYFDKFLGESTSSL